MKYVSRTVFSILFLVVLNSCAGQAKKEESYPLPLSVNQEVDPAYTSIRYESKFVPPDGKILLIGGQDKRSISKFVPAWGITPAGFAMYFGIDSDSGIWSDHSSFEGDPNEVNNFKWLTESYTNTVLQIALWMVGKADIMVLMVRKISGVLPVTSEYTFAELVLVEMP